MSPVNRYKEWENRAARNLTTVSRKSGVVVHTALRAFWTSGKQSLTVMVIPHSEQKILKFRISIFAGWFLALLAISVPAVTLYYLLESVPLGNRFRAMTNTVESAQTNVDLVREELAQLRAEARRLEVVIDSAFGTVGIVRGSTQQDQDTQDFSRLLETSNPLSRELVALKELRGLLSGSLVPMQQIGSVLSSQRSLLVDIPTLWPLKDVRGWVTNPFGPSVHPFTGQWYLHKGMDIAQSSGTPVVATANGMVSKVDFEALGYGNYVEIKHEYGFSTKYGHLLKSVVRRGQSILRGQVIAYVGSSGLSTGPHVHYEIRIGNQAIDPTKYLNFL